MKPVLLEPNLLRRFYRGGPRIAAFRGRPEAADDTPEDWVGSTTCVHGTATLGLSRLPDGRLLRDAVAADPAGYLGPDHVAVRGADPGLLVKLLDAGERLPVHCHPGREFASRHLGMDYGKTEAWVVLGTEPAGGTVHLGFGESISLGRLGALVDAQDVDGLLAKMNEIEVRPGDAWLVPAGVPHAIGEGLLILELQEPTDLSVLLEWRDYPLDGERDGHLGLGFDVALQSVDRSAWSLDRLLTLRASRGPGRVLPEDADVFFGLEWLAPDSRHRAEAGFAIVVAIRGAGSVECDSGDLPMRQGDTGVIGYGTGRWAVTGDLEVVVCRPPAPGTGW